MDLCFDFPTKCLMSSLFLLVFAKLTDTKGLCEFTDMFSAQTKITCFRGDSFQQTEDFAAINLCPSNMVLGNCSCVATCKDPNAEEVCFRNCTEGKNCVCPDGLLLKEEYCVAVEECGCFLAEIAQVLPNNTTYVNSNCSRRCVCEENVLTCDDEYECSPNEVCEEKPTGDGQTCTDIPTDCFEVFSNGFTESGIYTILPTFWPGSPFKVYCEMTNGTGWTVFQRRVNGSVDFFLDWEDYKQGFGFLDHEFWLGNDKIANLTNQKDYRIRIDLINSLGSSYYVQYSLFRIANEDDNYRLTHLDSYEGNAGYDALTYHLGYAFTTRDRDNDEWIDNCALAYRGAWWYRFPCQECNLNGGYFQSGPSSIEWSHLHGDQNNIQFTEMKIRPA